MVALDRQRGIAKAGAMPAWNLKQDEKFFAEQTQLEGGNILMGKKTLTEALHSQPLKNRTNYVVTHEAQVPEGVERVADLAGFIRQWPVDKTLWVIGGAEIFEQTMGQAEELYITEINGDFDCDRFYPEYKTKYKLSKQTEPVVEHGVSYRFCIYKPA